MNSLETLDELPAGYFVDESPRGVLAVSVDVAQALHESGFGPEHDGPLALSDLSGRRPLFQLELGAERFVVRRYHRGGLFRWFFPRTSLDPDRPFRELVLADALAKSGIRTPQVVAARVVRWGSARSIGALVLGWRLELVSRRVDNAVELAQALEAIRRGEVSPVARARLFRTAGTAIRSLHRVGFLHADLTPRNLLVRREALGPAVPEPWIIDLDSSVFVEDVTDAERRKNLRRFFRSVQRRERRGQRFLSRADYAHFMRGYDPDGKTWKADWRAIAAGHRWTRPLHLIGWSLERLFGSGAETRDGHATVE